MVQRFFKGTPSRIGGLTIDGLEREARARVGSAGELLETGGVYQWRRHGERHALDPEAIVLLQTATNKNSWESFTEFSDWVESSDQVARELRGLLEIVPTRPSVRLEDVEPD